MADMGLINKQYQKAFFQANKFYFENCIIFKGINKKKRKT